MGDAQILSCQPSSRSFLKVKATFNIEQIYTNFNIRKGNAETKGFMRTLKEKFLWLEEFAGLEETREKLSAWIDFYNKDYLHPAMGQGPIRDAPNFTVSLDGMEKLYQDSGPPLYPFP